MPFVPDEQPRKSRFVPDTATAAAQDTFAGDDLLSDEAMGKLADGQRTTVTRSPAPSPFKGVGKYFSGIQQAASKLNQAPQGPQLPFGLNIGTIEALGTMATGATTGPVLGAAESALLGTDPETAYSRYTYSPRTESGKAQLGMLGAVTAPLAESGADVALGPLAAEFQGIRRPLPKVKPEPIPTTQELTKAAKTAYAASKDAGVIVKPEGYTSALDKVRSVVTEEGIDPTLHPKSTAVMKRLEGANGQPLTLQQAETLRKIALDAEDDLNPVTRQPTPDARMASKIVDELDDSIDELSINTPAREIYKRSRRSQMIDQMIHRAEIKAGANYTQAGMEHALRQEFKQLALNERRMRGLDPAQRAAIEKVAKGGAIENSLRVLGKFDPTTGGMASLVSLGTGGLTSMALGPVGMAVPVGGFIGRRAATAMTKRNVGLAREALVGRGPPVMPEIKAAAQPAANLSGELMQRAPLALPAPSIVAGSRSAPGTAYARQEMGLTPDVEAAGALHPGMARTSIPPRAPALPYRPMADDSMVVDAQGRAAASQEAISEYMRQARQSAAGASHPGAPRPGVPRPMQALPYRPAEPMVVDPAGRVAASRAQLRQYLQDTGQDNLRNVRQPHVGEKSKGLFSDEPASKGLSHVEELEAEARRKGMFESPSPSAKQLAEEAEWLNRYKAAQTKPKGLLAG